MTLNREIIENLLDQGNNLAENQIKNKYRFYAQFDSDIRADLSEMQYFGGYGEFFEMVERFNQKLFN